LIRDGPTRQAIHARAGVAQMTRICTTDAGSGVAVGARPRGARLCDRLPGTAVGVRLRIVGGGSAFGVAGRDERAIATRNRCTCSFFGQLSWTGLASVFRLHEDSQAAKLLHLITASGCALRPGAPSGDAVDRTRPEVAGLRLREVGARVTAVCWDDGHITRLRPGSGAAGG